VLARLAAIPACADGEVFVLDPAATDPSGADPSMVDPSGADPSVAGPSGSDSSGAGPSGAGPSRWLPEPGQTVLLPGPGWDRNGANNLSWRIPASAARVRPPPYDYGLDTPAVLATPGGLDLSAVAYFRLTGELRVDRADADVVERVRNALAFDRGMQAEERAGVAIAATFGVVRSALLVATLVALVLATASLLVLSLEQTWERRRAQSMMVAAGCRRSTLAAALLWQTLVPMLLATVLAVGIGSGLAALLLAAASEPVRLDWATIGVLAGSAVAAVLLITALTLPALRSATRPESLRTD